MRTRAIRWISTAGWRWTGTEGCEDVGVWRGRHPRIPTFSHLCSFHRPPYLRPKRRRLQQLGVWPVLQHVAHGPGFIGDWMLEGEAAIGIQWLAFALRHPARDPRRVAHGHSLVRPGGKGATALL